MNQTEQMREMCAKLVENGNFLHNDSPEAKWSKGCAAAIRALPLPEVAPVQPSPAEPDPVVWVKTEDRMPDCDLIYFVDVKHNIGERDVIYEGTYEWRQGQNPDRFISARFGDIDAKAFTHWAERKPAAMPKMPVDTAQPVSNDVPVAQDSRAEFEEWNSKQKLPWGDAAWPYLDVQVMIYDRAGLVWKARQQEIDTLRESNATTLLHFDGINKELQELLVENAALKKVLEGLPEGAIDGGWTAKGISQHAAGLEKENAALKAKLEPKVWKELSDEDLIKLWITELDKGLCVTSPEIILRASIAADRELNK